MGLAGVADGLQHSATPGFRLATVLRAGVKRPISMCIPEKIGDAADTSRPMRKQSETTAFDGNGYSIRPARRLAASASIASTRRMRVADLGGERAAALGEVGAPGRRGRGCAPGAARSRTAPSRPTRRCGCGAAAGTACRARGSSARKRRLVERRRRVAARERVADDAIRLEERPQHAVRAERPEAAHAAPGSRRGRRASALLPVGVVQRELGAHLARGTRPSRRRRTRT